VEIGVSLPVFLPDATPALMLEFARQAEAAGAHSIWVGDRLVFRNSEPLLTLAGIAAVTSRVRLGTSVLLATLRPPALLAKMIAGLDQLSNGRVIMGFGVGSRADDFAAAGVPFERRGGRAEELVQILRTCWAGEPLRHSGTFYEMDTAWVGPRSAQEHVPIWFGGGAESALRRIARIGDGYIGSSSGGTEGFRANWRKVLAYADQAERDAAELTPAALIYNCVDPDRERALERASAHLANYYGPRRTDTSGFLLGPPNEVIERARAYEEAGVRVAILGQVTTDRACFDRLCGEVLPALA
jgi:probable F420-dependent oxidoreductase